MGKKSKRKSKIKPVVGRLATASASAPISTALDKPPADKPRYAAPPPGASCWICLEEGSDETGQLVRDCSCRGSAGFAHLACIVKYAEHLMQQHRCHNEVDDSWRKCPNCHQHYRNELAYDLATERVSFVEKNCPNDLPILLEALFAKLPIIAYMGLVDGHPEQRVECKHIANKLLSIIRVMKAKNGTSLWPEEFLLIEGSAYNILGKLALCEGTKESLKIAVEYSSKYGDICEAAGCPIVVKDAEASLALAKSTYGGSNDLGPEEKLKNRRDVYEMCVVQQGEGALCSMQSGVTLAHALEEAYHGIEAERLLAKLASISHQVHGSDHDITKQIKLELQIFKRRSVDIECQFG